MPYGIVRRRPPGAVVYSMDLTKKTRRVSNEDGVWRNDETGNLYRSGDTYRNEIYWVDSRTGKEYSSPEYAAREQENLALEKAQDVLQRAREHRERQAHPPNRAWQALAWGIVLVFALLFFAAASGGHR
jgi:hypothetical protein